ncbi:hypothetical protein E2C01_094972 [Portunus trituberculatus]|uniref:Uncharacterized protein n=1 Tax=Portunus trituberculatus TaxID=210409 RepID=A0A5B7JNL2_PORTR|nr:hypothetical protein [Portunus trituberculatus]
MASSQLYGAPHTPATPHTPDTPVEPDTPTELYPDPNTLRIGIGNSLGVGGGGASGGVGGVGRPPLPPAQRGYGVGYGAVGWSGGVDVESSYEPLFLATSEVPPTAPQAPQTGLLRRRSEHRRSGRRDNARRAASVGPAITPRPHQVCVWCLLLVLACGGILSLSLVQEFTSVVSLSSLFCPSL